MAYVHREQLTLQNQIRRMKRNIKNRLARIREVYGSENISKKVIDRYQEQYRKAITDENGQLIKITKTTPTTVLKDIFKQLTRLDIKKSTYSRDFARYTETIYQAQAYGVDLDKAFELYDKLVEGGKLLADYKYEVVQKIVEYKKDGLSDQEISDNIYQILDKLSGVNSTDKWQDAVNEVEYEKFYDYTSFS